MGAIIQGWNIEGKTDYALDTPEGDEDAWSKRYRAFLNEARKEVMFTSIKAQYGSGKNFDPGKIDHLGDLSAKVPADLYPPRLKLVRGKEIYDYSGALPTRVVSQRFRDVVEEIDPGVHQFVPVEIVNRAGNPCKGGPWYFFRVQRVLSAINMEGSSNIPPVGVGGSDHGDANRIQINSNAKLVVNADQVSSIGIWHDKRSPQHRFVSEKVLSRMKDAGLTGWEVRNPFEER